MNKLLLTVAALITAAGTAPVSAYALQETRRRKQRPFERDSSRSTRASGTQSPRGTQAHRSRKPTPTPGSGCTKLPYRTRKGPKSLSFSTLRERLWIWSNEVPARPSHKRKSPPRPQGKARRSPGKTGPPAEGLFANRPFLYTIIAIFASEKHYEKNPMTKVLMPLTTPARSSPAYTA